jgi:hypothetical protein
MMQTGYYIINGWVSKSKLYVDGLKVQNFPFQEDMRHGRQWIRPGDSSDVLSPANVVDTPAGYRHSYGGIVFTWNMNNLSPNMTSYLHNIMSDEENFIQKKYSTKVTAQTFNRATGRWETYHCVVRFPSLLANADAILGGYSNLQLNFVAYREAPQGHDLTASYTLSDFQYTLINNTINISVQNIGDTPTFNETVLQFDFNFDIELVSMSSIITSTKLYTYNGTTWFEGEPANPEDVVSVRFVVNQILLNGTTYQDFIITYQATEVGVFNSQISVDSDGDLDEDNNIIPVPVTISNFAPNYYEPRFWFNAEFDVYNDDGDEILAQNDETVEAWYDQINAISFSQNDNLVKPIYKIVGDIRGIEFSDEAYLTLSTGFGTPHSQNNTMIIILNPANLDANHEIIFQSGNTISRTIWSYKTLTDTSKTGIKTTTNNTINQDDAETGFQTLYFINNNTPNYFFYRDNILIDTVVSSLGQMRLQQNPSSIGGDTNGDNTFNGIIYEIIYYEEVLTTQQLNNIYEYISQKYL